MALPAFSFGIMIAHSKNRYFADLMNANTRLSDMVAISFALIMMVACSKKTDPVPVVPGGGGTGNPPPVVIDDFTPQTPGVSFKKVNNPKGITDYVLQIPDSYNEKKNTVKWPVIIFLHGMGERGTDLNKVKNAGLAGIAAKDKDFPYILISPQCKAEAGNDWWNNANLDVLYADVLKQYNVDPSRIYLTGLSMGGYGAWTWGQGSPDKFAAIIPICGGGTPSNACVLKNKPIWVFHNVDDGDVNVSNSRDMVDALKKCGSTLVKYTENPTGGHDAWTKAYKDPALFAWLSEQKK